MTNYIEAAPVGEFPELALTRLEPRNREDSIEEGLQARVADPLWMIGRQWQLGEFRAQDGGRPVRVELDVCFKPVNKMIPSLKNSLPHFINHLLYQIAKLF